MTEEKKETNHNLDLWESIEKTPPDQTKLVEYGQEGKTKRKFTAIDAYYRIKKATELWGPFGLLWGVKDETFEIVKEYNLLVYKGFLYYPAEMQTQAEKKPVEISHPYSLTMPMGSSNGCIPMANAIEIKDSKGRIDDEAWKKVKTDSLTKALSMIGMCADVFLGKFEDDRYVCQLKKEGASQEMPPNQSPKTREMPQGNAQNQRPVPNHSTPQQNPATTEKMASAVSALRRAMIEKLGSDEKVLSDTLKKISGYQNKEGKIVFATDFSKLSEKWAERLILEFKKYLFEMKIIDYFAERNGGDRAQADLEYGSWLEENTRSEGHDKGLEYVKQITSEKWLNVIKGKWEKFVKEQEELNQEFCEHDDSWIPDRDKPFEG